MNQSEIDELKRERDEWKAKVGQVRQEIADALPNSVAHLGIAEAVRELVAENKRLTSALKSVDFYLDEFSCGMCSVPPTAEASAVPAAVNTAMTVLRFKLAEERKKNHLLGDALYNK